MIQLKKHRQYCLKLEHLMKHKNVLEGLSRNFHDEETALLSIGVNTWEKVNELNQNNLNHLAETSRATLKNLNRIKSISLFVCNLKLTPSEASLLMHSGIASIKALANSSPQEIIFKTGRLKRQLSFYSDQSLGLNTAKNWIERANELLGK